MIEDIAVLSQMPYRRVTVTVVLGLPIIHPRYTISAVLPWECTNLRGNYRGYHGSAAFPITVDDRRSQLNPESVDLLLFLQLASVDSMASLSK